MGALTWKEGTTRLAFPSGSDFTSSGTNYEPTYQGVKLSSGNVVACAANTDEIIGIIMNCPTTGDTADVLSINAPGTGKVQAGGTIAVGNYLTMNASGYAVAATQTTAGSQPVVRVFGRALTAAASGQLVEFQILYFLY